MLFPMPVMIHALPPQVVIVMVAEADRLEGIDPQELALPPERVRVAEVIDWLDDLIWTWVFPFFEVTFRVPRAPPLITLIESRRVKASGQGHD